MQEAHRPLGLDVKTVAASLGLHPITVRRMIKARTLRAVRIGRRVVIPAAALEELLENNTATRAGNG